MKKTQDKPTFDFPAKVWASVFSMISNHAENRPCGPNVAIIVKGGNKWSITPDIMGRCIHVVNNGNLEHANLLEQRLANAWRERGKIKPAFSPAQAAMRPEAVKAMIAEMEKDADAKYAVIDEKIEAIQKELSEATTIERFDVPLHGWGTVVVEAPVAGL